MSESKILRAVSGGLQRPTREQAEQAIRTMLQWAGDDPDREGLIDTPERVTRAFGTGSAATNEDPEE